ncbi:hypothetical protein [Aliikangiella sp. IMCC44359]|uniref:hypothetical protein n=1 Tax=Aliikangiella sp. IMCC44359 TaxID=3459125 RepID=UPI00403B3423
MIEYAYDEEKIVALHFAALLNNTKAEKILKAGVVTSGEEATILSQFFWEMINKSAEGNIHLPCSGSSQYWTEKLYNTLGGYLESSGYEKQWNTEIDNA